MNTTPAPTHTAPPPTEGQALRSSAVRKIEQARTLLDAARHDLCNLEGPAKKPFYCDVYDKVGQFDRELSALTQRLRDMPPPTGVFKI